MSSPLDQFKEKTAAGALEQIRQFDRPIIIECDIATVVDLVGMVQLALRHPNARKLGAAQRTERFITDLIEKTDPGHGDLWKVLNLGFNPLFDE